jgi:hypothetical protein
MVCHIFRTSVLTAATKGHETKSGGCIVARLFVDRGALDFDAPCAALNRTESSGPIIPIAAYDHPVAVMLDFVDPAGAGWRS